MSEERLQEIKDSIDLQEKIMTKNMLVDEEKELYDEVVRLTNIINELEKELDRGYRDLFEHELVPGRELITNIKNYIQELKGDSSNGNK